MPSRRSAATNPAPSAASRNSSAVAPISDRVKMYSSSQPPATLPMITHRRRVRAGGRGIGECGIGERPAGARGGRRTSSMRSVITVLPVSSRVARPAEFIGRQAHWPAC